MKWNKKFNYTPLNRIPIDGSRHYDTGQKRLPSVSTIISLTKPIEEKVYSKQNHCIKTKARKHFPFLKQLKWQQSQQSKYNLE